MGIKILFLPISLLASRKKTSKNLHFKAKFLFFFKKMPLPPRRERYRTYFSPVATLHRQSLSKKSPSSLQKNAHLYFFEYRRL